jgi:outer membrane protein TolC
MRSGRLFAVIALISIAGRADNASASAIHGAQAARDALASSRIESLRLDLSLSEAVALGLRQNRTIKSAYLQRVSQKFDLRVAENQFTPKLTLSSSYTRRRDEGVGGFTFDASPVVTMQSPLGTQVTIGGNKMGQNVGGYGYNALSDVNLEIIQPLLKGGGYDVNMAPLRIARLSEKINVLTLEVAVSRSITSIITSYRALMLSQEQLKINQESLDRQNNLLSLNKELIKSGRMASAEIIQTEANVAKQELSIEQSANAVQSSRMALLDLLALDPSTNIGTTESIDPDRMSIDVDDALKVAFENEPVFLSQIIQEKISELNLLVAENQRSWDLSVVAGTSVSKQTPANSVTTVGPSGTSTTLTTGPSQQRSSYAGFQLTIPIWDLTPEQAEVKAKVSVETSQIQIDDARQSLEHQTRDAVRGIDTSWRQCEIARRARELAGKAVEIERDKLRAGRSSNFQVLSLETDLRLAESNEISAKIAYLNSLTLLDQQIGTALNTWQVSIGD